jgi:alpha-galactosidase
MGTDREPTFSFMYDGRPSSELLAEWPTATAGDTTTWTAPDGFQVRLERRDYDGRATGWLLRFENTGSTRSGLLEKVRCLDARAAVTPFSLETVTPLTSTIPRLYRSRGTFFSIGEFEYVEDRITRGERVTMGSGGGTSSGLWMPYLLTDLGGRGAVYAIGWSGAWAATVSHEDSEELHIEAGLAHLRLRLDPGEGIRGARILAMPWQGTRIDAHNAFRRLLLRHHSPRVDGKVIDGPFCTGHWGGMTTEHHVERIAVYAREQIRQEYLWIDAGWFADDPSHSPNDWSPEWSNTVGDWQVNPYRHPHGLSPIAEAAEAAGMKTLLWAEPGRAHVDTPWVRDHPDWFLTSPTWQDHVLLDFGNAEARAGAVEMVSSMIREARLTIYREDLNIDPGSFWAAKDEPDRVGIAEIRYIEGHYAFWDELRARHPWLIIDNCASGGRRLDLELISRSVGLWRTDYECFVDYAPIGPQAAGMSISHWLPLHGTGTWASLPTRDDCSTYRVRSTFAPAFQLSSFVRQNQQIQDDYPWDWVRRMGDEYLRCRPYFTADYYPLTGARAAHETPWAAYQMNSPERGGGFVMAFRRAAPTSDRFVAVLHGLDPDARYTLENVDTGTTWNATGAELAAGLAIELDEPESSALIFYDRLGVQL